MVYLKVKLILYYEFDSFSLQIFQRNLVLLSSQEVKETSTCSISCFLVPLKSSSVSPCFFFFLRILFYFIQFWLHWVFVAVCRLLIVVASLVAEHGLQVRRLSSCGSQAQLLCGMWDLPGPGFEPVSPALAGRFLTTVPLGTPQSLFLCFNFYSCNIFQSRSVPYAFPLPS